MHAGDSPPSMSMHEEVDAVPARASAFSWPSSSRDLSSSSRAHPGFMHAVSLFLVAIAVVLLMAPAAYHRIVYAGEVSEDMHRVGSALVTAATVPLALGLAGDVCVVITKIAGSQLPGGGSLALVFLNRALASALEPGQLLDTQIRRFAPFSTRSTKMPSWR